MSKKIYLIVGASGSGKDTTVDCLCKVLGKTKVISRTTRKPRYEGEKTHIFITNEQADKEFDNSVARTIFNGNRYYATKEDVLNSDFYIIDPYGVRTMDRKDLDIEVCYLKIRFITRAWRMFKRGDKLKSILSRLINDHREFKNFEKESDVVFRDNNDMIEYFLNKNKATNG